MASIGEGVDVAVVGVEEFLAGFVDLGSKAGLFSHVVENHHLVALTQGGEDAGTGLVDVGQLAGGGEAEQGGAVVLSLHDQLKLNIGVGFRQLFNGVVIGDFGVVVGVLGIDLQGDLVALGQSAHAAEDQHGGQKHRENLLHGSVLLFLFRLRGR